MKHVTRFFGSRLHASRTPYINNARFSSSFAPLGGKSEAESALPNASTRTLRPRSHGNTALPVSALFDPVTVAARTKYEEPKEPSPQDPAQLTDFQRELAQNVHAQALATPVRTCVLTKARLPAHFLIPFISQLPPKTSNASKHTNLDTTPEPPTLDSPLSATKPSLLPRLGPWAHKSPQPSSYVLAKSSAIEHLAGLKMRKAEGGSKWAMLVNERMKKPWAVREGKSTDKVVVGKEWEWDEEMAERVKGLLGREIVRKVGWCLKKGGESVGKDGEGVVVQIGGEETVPGEFDLRRIMGQEGLHELRGMFDGAETLVLRKHPKTVFTVLALEALKNYTVDSGGGT